MSELAVTPTPRARRDASAPRSIVSWFRRLFYLPLLLTTFLGAAELTARIQDRFVRGVPIMASPDWDRDLFIDTPTGRRGRPNGRFRHWALNEFGFRSAQMSRLPAEATVRVALLGASETFGLYETPGKEYSAQLSRELLSAGSFEVVNTALPGLTLSSARRYYEAWVADFHPSLVVIYPSPLFYLRDIAPGTAPSSQPAGPSAIESDREQDSHNRVSSRLFQRLRDTFDVPEGIQRHRDARVIEKELWGRPDGWLFTSVPADRLDRFLSDLAVLVHVIESSDARVIVATHASRISKPPSRNDLEWLWRARVTTPRAIPEVIAAFEKEANRGIRRWAQANGVALVDVAAMMDGEERYFSDLVHFNDKGAAEVARLMSDAIVRFQVQPAASRRTGALNLAVQ